MEKQALTLSEALDFIRESDDPSEAATLAARMLDDDGLLVVAALDVGARIGSAVTEVDQNGAVRYGALTIALARASDGPISYEDRDVTFSLSGLRLDGALGPPRLDQMLRLLGYARDHSDNLAFLPIDVRADRIAAVAVALGAQPQFVRQLSAMYPTSARELGL